MKRSLLSTALVLSLASAAHAAPAAKPTRPADRKAVAAALFQDGIRALEAGRTAEACDKLTESVATLPDSGAMGALAECDTELGRLAEAWELWQQLATSAPTAELRADAAKNAAELDHRLVRVTLRLAGAAPPDLAVTLNDKLVRPDDRAVHRVSPGALHVVASSPDIQPWRKTLDAQPGAALTLDIPLAASHAATSRRHKGRIGGLVIAGAGVVALGTAAVFTGLAYSDWNGASSSCGGDTDHCKSSGYLAAQDQLSSARSSATIATWSGVAGTAALATGLILYFVFREPESSWHAAPIAGNQTVGLSLTRSLP